MVWLLACIQLPDCAITSPDLELIHYANLHWIGERLAEEEGNQCIRGAILFYFPSAAQLFAGSPS